MIVELIYEGPGTGDFNAYLWQVAAALLGAFLLGIWFRSLLNNRYKREVKDLEDENSILRAKSAPTSVDTSEFERKIKEQKLEITRQSEKLNDCYTEKVRLENEVVSSKNKIAMLSNSSATASSEPTSENKDKGLKASISSTPVKEETSKSSPKAVDSPLKAGPSSKTPKKTTTKKEQSGKADDLKKIEGVGPKIASLLTEGGLPTFEALASASVNDIKSILASAGSNYAVHDPSTWSEQAKLAADGEWDKLKSLQEKLKGGKKT